MLLRIQIEDDLIDKLYRLKKYVIPLLILYSLYIFISQNIFGERVTIELPPNSLLALIHFLLAIALCISLTHLIYDLIKKGSIIIKIGVVFMVFFSTIFFDSFEEMTFFAPWSEIALYVTIFSTIIIVWEQRKKIALLGASLLSNKIVKQLKHKCVQQLRSIQLAEFIQHIRRPSVVSLIRIPYLILYGLVFVVGTILEIILFPFLWLFKLYYNFFSSRAVVFVLNQFLTVMVIFGGIWMYDSNGFLQNQVTKLVKRAGGQDTLSCSQDDTIHNLNRSIVRVIGAEAEGSGFVYDQIEGKSIILTNYHVIADEPSPKIVYDNNKFLPATIISADKDADVAVLAIDVILPKVTWGNIYTLNYGQDLLSIGFPFGRDIIGDPSVKRGGYYGKRETKERSIVYIQTDATINEGMSGGVTTDICGKVMGMNTLGAPGLGMSISSNSIHWILEDLNSSPNKEKDIAKIQIYPDKSPEDTVHRFFNYIKIGDLEKAYDLLSPELQSAQSFEDWKAGYHNTLQVEIVSIQPSEIDPTKLKIKINKSELNGDEISDKYYEGVWYVNKLGDHNRIVSNEVIAVDPDWLWFYE